MFLWLGKSTLLGLGKALLRLAIWLVRVRSASPVPEGNPGISKHKPPGNYWLLGTGGNWKQHVPARLRNSWSRLVSRLAGPATLVALLELGKVWMLSQEGLAPIHGSHLWIGGIPAFMLPEVANRSATVLQQFCNCWQLWDTPRYIPGITGLASLTLPGHHPPSARHAAWVSLDFGLGSLPWPVLKEVR